MLSVPIATGNNAVDLGGISIVQQSTQLAAHTPESSTSFALNAGNFDQTSRRFSMGWHRLDLGNSDDSPRCPRFRVSSDGPRVIILQSL